MNERLWQADHLHASLLSFSHSFKTFGVVNVLNFIMGRGLGSLVWLCWILSSLLPLVQCQGGQGPDFNPFSHGRKHGPFGDGQGGFGRGGHGGGFGEVSSDGLIQSISVYQLSGT